MTTYSAKSAAVRAARADLGSDAILGIDFTVSESGGRWTWTSHSLMGGNAKTAVETIRIAGTGGEENPDTYVDVPAIRAEHVPGNANHFRLNEAGRKAIRAAKGIPEPKHEPEVAARQDRQLLADAVTATRMSAKHRLALDAAREGHIPSPPDFSAETHKRWRPKLDAVIALVNASDLDGLKDFEIKPVSTSPKAIARFRDLAVIAFEARKARAG